MSEELKPCPFCGGVADTSERYNDIWTAFCTECGAEIGLPASCNDRDEAEAIEAWNKRAQTYDQGFDNGVKATLQQLDGLVHDCCTVEEVRAWIDRQWEEEVVA